MKVILVICFISLLVSGCGYVNNRMGLTDDNIIEEVTESAIKAKTGIDVDLTPGTPE